MTPIQDARSPLKSKPLRNPGQWCEERRQELFEQKLEIPMLAAALAIMLAAMELARWYWSWPPQPLPFIVIAAGFTTFAAIRFRVYRPQIRNLTLGAEGERAVAQFLDRLRAQGYEVFHDVPANGFNVDHVLVGPAGVFSVETKTWAKRGIDPRLAFDGQTLLLNGESLQSDPVRQACAQSSWLVTEIEAGTGRRYPVRPVILFPGWYIESGPRAHEEIWVLEPKALPRFLEQENARMERHEIQLVAYHLSRYIRTFVARA